MLRSREDLCDALGLQFSDEQLACITAPLEPHVIIAGAGTGKTTVMAARVVWLVGTGQVRAGEVLGLTFTRKAAQELGARVRAALTRAGAVPEDEEDRAETVATYDSFAAGVVSEFGLRIGLDQEPILLSGASRFRLAARVVAQAAGPFTSINRLQPSTIQERLLDLDAQLSSHLVEPEQVRELTRHVLGRLDEAPQWRGRPTRDVAAAMAACEERLELLRLVEDYQALKARLGVVEFADQLRRAVDLVRRVPDVALALRSRFRVVLLDEYQDTSAAQAVLLRALFSGAEPPARGFPVTAVGDPNQAIYGWRGAAANNIMDFPTLFPRRDGSAAARLTLSLNRRSGQQILDVGNRIAVGLGEHVAVRLTAPPGTPPGVVEAGRHDTWGEELDTMSERVVAEHSTGTNWGDMAVLVRRNTTLVEVFNALRDREVPVEIVGVGGLLHLPEVAPVVATLRVLADPAANPAVSSLLTGPRWRIGLADMEALGARSRRLAAPRLERPDTLADSLAHVLAGTDPAEGGSLLEAVLDPGDAPVTAGARERLGKFSRELAYLGIHSAEPVPDLARRVAAVIGIEAELLAAGRDTSQLERFLSILDGYVDVDGDGSLLGLLSYLDAEDAHGEGLEQAVPSTEDSVKLLTVHRAKGLEWETVFWPSLVEGIFPSSARTGIWPTRAAALPSPLRGDATGIPQLSDFSKKGMEALKEATRADHLSSEDRLAYVAATRAKRLLIASGHVWTPGLKRPKDASAYLLGLAEQAGVALGPESVSQTNPVPLDDVSATWPVGPDPDLAIAREEAATWVAEARTLLGEGASSGEISEWLWSSGVAPLDAASKFAGWDRDLAGAIESLGRRHVRDLRVPDGLSTTDVMLLATDPDRFADRLIRPMPRRPSRGASLGSRFHDWVQDRFRTEMPLFEEMPAVGPAVPGLERLVAAFEAGRFAGLQPVGVEVPFLLRWADVVLRGRIDAVYRWDGEPFTHLVVDWKTSNQPADPLQLAVYRQAWAKAQGLAPERVGAAFYHVLTDELVFSPASSDLIDAALTLG